jgi:hypothetical protein
MTIILLSAALIVSVLFLTRTLFIIIGWHKGPVLKQFEKYGDDENFYYWLPSFIGWLGVFIVSGNFWVEAVWGVAYPFTFFGGLLIVMAYAVYRYPSFLGHPPALLLTHPRWLHELRGRTTRLERRRIAYMWLHLPLKLRLIYNSNDRAFLHWADMIIISTFI